MFKLKKYFEMNPSSNERLYLNKILIGICLFNIPLNIYSLFAYRNASALTISVLCIFIFLQIALLFTNGKKTEKLQKSILILFWLLFTAFLCRQNINSNFIDSSTWFLFPGALFFWLFIGRIYALILMVSVSASYFASNFAEIDKHNFLIDSNTDFPVAVFSTFLMIFVVDKIYKFYRLDLQRYEERLAVQAMTITYSHHINNPLAIAMGKLRQVRTRGHQDQDIFDAIEALERISQVMKKAAKLNDHASFEKEIYIKDLQMFKLD